MIIFQLVCLCCGVLILLSGGNIGGSLDYSQVYCEDCKIWYTPKSISESTCCPKCKNNNVHGDE